MKRRPAARRATDPRAVHEAVPKRIDARFDALAALGFFAPTDVACGSLVNPDDGREAQMRKVGLRFALDLGAGVRALNGRKINDVLHSVFGPVREALFLAAGPPYLGILVFDQGVGLRTGLGTAIPLAFGYAGQGSSAFSALLKAAGFAKPDVSGIEPPVILHRDGTLTRGTRGAGEIRWEDGRITSFG